MKSDSPTGRSKVDDVCSANVTFLSSVSVSSRLWPKTMDPPRGRSVLFRCEFPSVGSGAWGRINDDESFLLSFPVFLVFGRSVRFNISKSRGVYSNPLSQQIYYFTKKELKKRSGDDANGDNEIMHRRDARGRRKGRGDARPGVPKRFPVRATSLFLLNLNFLCLNR